LTSPIWPLPLHAGLLHAGRFAARFADMLLGCSQVLRAVDKAAGQVDGRGYERGVFRRGVFRQSYFFRPCDGSMLLDMASDFLTRTLNCLAVQNHGDEKAEMV
jgi:hypothetical protein